MAMPLVITCEYSGPVPADPSGVAPAVHLPPCPRVSMTSSV
ncbi:MAG TPA: hypothetical protein VGD91_25825 [Trebonia sp.]